MSSPNLRPTSSETEPPSWEPAVGDRLLEAQRATPLLGRVAPRNLAEELRSLEADFARGRERPPRFAYEPAPPSHLERELHALAGKLDRIEHPLAPLYAAKAREIALEQRLCERVGREDFWSVARTRYPMARSLVAAADALAGEWVSPTSSRAPGDRDEPTDVVSDDEHDPKSLVSRMRAEVGARRLPFRVVTHDRMSALAATGSGVIVVASGRRVSVTDVERTVLHELEGHALPQVEAERRSLALFRLGTASGSDDQEGRALDLEDRHGWLMPQRRRELALRHLACRTVAQRADFVTTVRALRELEATLPDALRIAARAHRGGGLAREAVYLPCLLRVRDALSSDPSLEPVLACGRIAVDAAPAVKPWLAVWRAGAAS